MTSMAVSGSVSKTVESPCVRLCRIDKSSGLCTGCMRTLDEIARWSSMGDEARKVVMNGLGGRSHAAGIGEVKP